MKEIKKKSVDWNDIFKDRDPSDIWGPDQVTDTLLYEGDLSCLIDWRYIRIGIKGTSERNHESFKELHHLIGQIAGNAGTPPLIVTTLTQGVSEFVIAEALEKGLPVIVLHFPKFPKERGLEILKQKLIATPGCAVLATSEEYSPSRIMGNAVTTALLCDYGLVPFSKRKGTPTVFARTAKELGKKVYTIRHTLYCNVPALILEGNRYLIDNGFAEDLNGRFKTLSELKTAY